MEGMIGYAVWGVLGLGFLAILPNWILGLVVISEEKVGIVVKSFSTKQLPPGDLIALNGEAGIQADTLPPGWHFGYWRWMYSIEKANTIDIPGGQLGLVVARAGSPIPDNRILGRQVDCNNFQDARKFLTSRGQKGKQISMLTSGTYRINTQVFEIVKVVPVLEIDTDKIGVVTVEDGEAIAAGEIAARTIPGHNSFQDAQTFLDSGGQRGLQEQILLSGSWNLNPWFANVSIQAVTVISMGHVGVVISYVGKEHKDISGESFKHGDLVEVGHKGVWAEPLYPGKHAINPMTMKVEVVPTTNIALNWATNRSEAHKLDERLSSIAVRSKDGFSFMLDVAQIIHVGAKEASKVISRFGSMKNLVEQVLEPAIGNYFRNSAQNHTVLDFLSARSERQKEALGFIRDALQQYDIEAVDTYIGDIVPPKELMDTQTERMIAQEQKKTFEVKEAAMKQRQGYEKEQSVAEIQHEIVKSEQQVKIQEFQANAAIKKAEGEAKSITLRANAEAAATEAKGKAEATVVEAVGLANAKSYEAGAKAMGEDYGKLQIMKVIGERNVKVTPDTLITGGQDQGGGPGLMMSAIMADMLRKKLPEEKKKA